MIPHPTRLSICSYLQASCTHFCMTLLLLFLSSWSIGLFQWYQSLSSIWDYYFFSLLCQYSFLSAVSLYWMSSWLFFIDSLFSSHNDCAIKSYFQPFLVAIDFCLWHTWIWDCAIEFWSFLLFLAMLRNCGDLSMMIIYSTTIQYWHTRAPRGHFCFSLS